MIDERIEQYAGDIEDTKTRRRVSRIIRKEAVKYCITDENTGFSEGIEPTKRRKALKRASAVGCNTRTSNRLRTPNESQSSSISNEIESFYLKISTVRVRGRPPNLSTHVLPEPRKCVR